MKKKYNFAYTAGYFDGDACFECSKGFDKRDNRFYYRIRIRVVSTNKKILVFFQEIFGGNINLTKGHYRNQKWKYQYCYSICGIKAFNLIEKIIPYLVEKKEEAKILFSFFQTNDNNKKNLLIEKLKNLKKFENLIKIEHKKKLQTIKNTIQSTKENFAYFAGLIDAEGCFKTSTYKGSTKILLCCNNSKILIFKWIISRFGGNIYFVNRSKANNKHRDQFYWYLSSKSLFSIINNIYPFLQYKKTVCKKLIQIHNLNFSVGGDRQSKSFTKKFYQVQNKKLKLIEQVHHLNLKGITSELPRNNIFS